MQILSLDWCQGGAWIPSASHMGYGALCTLAARAAAEMSLRKAQERGGDGGQMRTCSTLLVMRCSLPSSAAQCRCSKVSSALVK